MSLFSAQRANPMRAVFRKARTALLSAAFFSGIINILMLTGSVFMMQVYDRVLSSRSIPTLVALASVTIALYAFTGLLEFIRTRMMSRFGRLADSELRLPVFNRMVEEASRRSPGSGGTQAMRDLDSIRQFLSGPGPFSLFDMPWVPVYVAVCYLLHPVLGWVAIGAALIMFTLALLNEWASRLGTQATARAAVRSHVMAEEAHQVADVLRALGMQTTVAARWAQNADEVAALQMRAADRASIFSSVSKVFRFIMQSAALGIGAYLAIRGEITAGLIIGGSIIMSRALAPIDQAIAQWRLYVSYRQAKTRLGALLKAAGPGSDERMTLPAPRGDIAAEGAIVLAPGTQTPIIAGITFALPAGSGLGIIGPTGAGKSSLARALVGVWPAAKGAIRIDGAKLEQWPPNQIGRAIGYVPQEVTLLSGSIQDNIARFDPRPDPEAVVAAAHKANVHEMIIRLPEGYNTILGVGGMQLSGGQRQRIALARALYGDPAILVLDEPNSNLDGDGEAALLATMQEARREGRTVVVIAHKPSVMASVDYLLYLQEGRQIAFGPKEEVLAKLSRERKARASQGLSVVGE